MSVDINAFTMSLSDLIFMLFWIHCEGYYLITYGSSSIKYFSMISDCDFIFIKTYLRVMIMNKRDSCLNDLLAKMYLRVSFYA